MVRTSARALVAAVVAVTLIVAGCGTSEDGSTPAATAPTGAVDDVVGGGSVGDDEEDAWVAQTVLEGVAGGLSGGGGEALFGFVLGAAGGAGGDEKALEELAQELSEIEQTLTDIEDELETINTSIEQLGCDIETNTIQPSVDAIRNLWANESLDAPASATTTAPPLIPQTYVELVNDAKDGDADPAEMEQFVDRVLDIDGASPDGQSVPDHLSNIADALGDTGSGSEGIIVSCLKANPASGYDGRSDLTYYDDVVKPLLQYYSWVQTQGVVMVVESYHYLAWQVEKPAIAEPSTIAASLCSDPTSPQVDEYCQSARTEYAGGDGETGVRAELVDQFTLAGAPYTTEGSGVEQQRAHVVGTDLLFANIEDFTTASGADCPTPMTSDDPCGPTVGSAGLTDLPSLAFGPTGDFDGYTGWKVATGPELEAIFTAAPADGGYANSEDTLGAYLTGVSAALTLPADDAIVITPTVGSISLPWGPTSFDADVICFLDGGWTRAAQTQLTGPACGGDPQLWAPLISDWRSLPAASENGGFYLAWFTDETAEADATPPSQTDASDWPGWIAPGSPDHPQFHWPVIDVTTLACTDGRSATNASGVATMCGDDLDEFVAAIIPDVASS